MKRLLRQIILGKLPDINRNDSYYTAYIKLSYGADPESRNIDQETPLIVASMFNQIDIVKLLLNIGVNTNAKTGTGMTALSYASAEGNAEIVDLLLKPKEDSPDELEYGTIVDERDMDGLTSLMYASQQPQLDIIRLLLEAGADVNAEDNDGWTPIMFAASKKHEEVVKFLIDHGANISVRNNILAQDTVRVIQQYLDKQAR